MQHKIKLRSLVNKCATMNKNYIINDKEDTEGRIIP